MRDTAMSSPRATLDPRGRPAPAGHPVMRYPTRAYQPDRDRREPPRRALSRPWRRPAHAGLLTVPLDRRSLHISCSHPQRLSLIHISEPTRRTPISYAVFCLKKKKKKKPNKKPHITYATETLTQNTNHTNRQ